MATGNFTNTNDPWSSFDTQPIRSEPGSQALDPARLTSTLDQILRTSSNEHDATMRWTDLVRQATGAKGVLLFGSDTNGELSPIPVCKNPSAIAESAIAMLYGLSVKAVREAAVQFAQAGTDSERIAAAVPVMRADRQPESLVVFVPMGPHEPRVLASLAQVLQFLAGYAGAWRGNWEPFQTIRQASPTEVVSDRESSDTDRPVNVSLLPDASSQRLLETIKLASASSSIGEAAEIWCRYIADGLDTRMMAIGLTRRSGICRLMAMAPCYQFDRNAPLVTSLESVMSETLLRMDGESIEVERRSTEATRILREQTGASHVYSHVLRDGRQQAIGVCLLLAETPLSESRQKSWRERSELSGTHLGTLRQSAPSYLQAGIASWRSLTGHQRRTAVAALILALTGMAAIPLPYRLTCRAEIQPVDRRYVATPYEGRLERAFVHPGDLITRGQLVARMDGRELRLEMAGIDSERERISKERDRAIVMGDTASAQLALLEVQRLDLRRQMFQTRLDNLEVRSPVDGVVISGEPKKLEGARLNQGQSLVEIGSLGEMVLEIAIPDSDIEQAEIGRAVKCQLDSHPGVPIRGVLISIQPRSELRDAGNVFVGRVELESTANELRPGMRGRARLATAPQSLAWILFHRIWEQLLFRVGW